MKYSLSWLKEFVSIPSDIKPFSEKLAEIGFPVESISNTGVAIENIVTAKVLNVEKHPNADRLAVTRVFDGKEERTVVCGAPNVRAGLVVAMAKPGTRFPQGLEITVSKIRGVESHGMLCSERELALSESHAGILELPAETPIGVPISSVFSSDTILDIDITPNRPDVLSHIGLAREISVLTGKKLTLSQSASKAPAKSSDVSVKIDESKLCSLYLGKVIEGIKVGPSPDWMSKRLAACGVRPINNVVDITNYILLETGHPLHAFDLDKVSGAITVRLSKPGEEIEALDGRTYSLTEKDLVIADQSGPVAIAGIMGGQSTGVSESTTRILLESAVFARTSIHATSKRLTLKSESSVRFEKGTDVNSATLAAERAFKLLEKICGGRLNANLKAGSDKVTLKSVSLRNTRLEQISGIKVNPAKIKSILTSLSFAPKAKGSLWACTIPPHRKDVSEEVDLIEEVVRFVGYDKIPMRVRVTGSSPVPDALKYDDFGDLTAFLKASGLNETISSSFVESKDVSLFSSSSTKPIALANPLSAEESLLRPSLLAGLMKAAQRNIHHQRSSARFFEIGNVFDEAFGENSMFGKLSLAGLVYGDIASPTWSSSQKSVDFYWIKGHVESLIRATEMPWKIEVGSKSNFLHPHQSFTILSRGKAIGSGGLIHPSVLAKFDMTVPCAVFETELINLERPFHPFVPFSKFPSVERDVAIWVADAVQWSEIEKTVRKAGGAALVNVAPFDIYVSEGKKSIAFRCRIQSQDHTLSEQEIESIVNAIKSAVTQAVGATLR